MFISPEGICAVVVPCCCVILARNARQPIKKLVHVKLSFPGMAANWWCGFSGGTREYSYMFSVAREYINHLGGMGLVYQQQYRIFRFSATSG